MANSTLTKLTWKKQVKFIPTKIGTVIEVNNSTLSVLGEEQVESIGRKPYLISKEYVLPGEPYDYLAMMNTAFTYGENNSWVTGRKPYKNKDYNLTYLESIGVASEQIYETKIYSSNPEIVEISNISNKGGTTVATVVGLTDGACTIYAEDAIGNKISILVIVSGIVVHRSLGGYYRLGDLIDGVDKPYTVFTVGPNEFINPIGHSYEIFYNSWVNPDGEGFYQYRTVRLNDGTLFVSYVNTYSITSTSYNKYERWQSYMIFCAGGSYPYIYPEYQHDVYDGGTGYYSLVAGGRTQYHKFGDTSFYFSETASLWWCFSLVGDAMVGNSIVYTGYMIYLDYKNSNLYVFTANDCDGGASTQYSGIFYGESFGLDVAWVGETPKFGYV